MRYGSPSGLFIAPWVLPKSFYDILRFFQMMYDLPAIVKL